MNKARIEKRNFKTRAASKKFQLSALSFYGLFFLVAGLVFCGAIFSQTTVSPSPTNSPTQNLQPQSSPTQNSQNQNSQNQNLQGQTPQMDNSQTKSSPPKVAKTPPRTATNFHQWGAVTLFNGLPSDNVRAVAQTGDGVLWFGTDNGLAKFDGQRVQAVQIENAGQIHALKTAADGALWIGASGGAFVLRGGQFQRIEDAKNFSVTDIFFDTDTFLATENGVILRVAANGENSFRVEKIPADPLIAGDGQLLKITSLTRVGDKLIAGTRGRAFLLVENNQVFETYSRPRPFFVNALAPDRFGNVWLGADSRGAESGFFSVRDTANLQRIGEATGNVAAIAPDAAGGAWLGTAANGLYHFRGEQSLEHFTFENTAGGLRSNTVYAVFIDRESVLWIGTNRGVSRFDASSPFNKIVADNANANFVRGLFRAANGQIFVGTNRGLFSLNNDDLTAVDKFSEKTIYTIGADEGGQFLIAASSGLYDFNGAARLTGDARAVANFQGKTYAAVFGRGVLQIDTQTVVLANDSPTALFSDGKNKLWIGTARDGVFRFDGKETKAESNLEKLRGAPIRRIVQGAENDLWLASERGLFLYRNGELQTVLDGADTRDVVIIGADVWAATLRSGLVHLRFDEQFGWLKTNLSVEQGLPSEQVFAVLPLDEQLLVGTNRGIAFYAPKQVEPQIVAARILSQRLHSAEELNGVIALDFPQNSLLVETAGLSSRTFPEQFQYAFVLKNSKGEILDKKISNDSQFTPANLAAGAYEIVARVFNKDLIASAPLTIKFSVARAPFPWTATALGALLLIALVGLAWAMIERRRIAKRNRELRAARFELANEAERERKRIAQDLHDQTLADLRALMLMSDDLPVETTGFRDEIESISIEIRRICEDLSPSVLENVGLMPALEFLLSHTVQNYKFAAEETLDERLNFKPNAQMQIYRIAQEVLNNIKRHSDANFIEMKIETTAENEFVLSIFDDGKNFSPLEKSAKGRGINNIKSRAAIIEAKIFWSSPDAGGNLFRLKKCI